MSLFDGRKQAFCLLWIASYAPAITVAQGEIPNGVGQPLRGGLLIPLYGLPKIFVHATSALEGIADLVLSIGTAASGGRKKPFEGLFQILFAVWQPLFKIESDIELGHFVPFLRCFQIQPERLGLVTRDAPSMRAAIRQICQCFHNSLFCGLLEKPDGLFVVLAWNAQPFRMAIPQKPECGPMMQISGQFQIMNGLFEILPNADALSESHSQGIIEFCIARSQIFHNVTPPKSFCRSLLFHYSLILFPAPILPASIQPFKSKTHS